MLYSIVIGWGRLLAKVALEGIRKILVNLTVIEIKQYALILLILHLKHLNDSVLKAISSKKCSTELLCICMEYVVVYV